MRFNKIYLEGDEVRIQAVLVYAKAFLDKGISVIDLNPQIKKDEEDDGG